MKMIPRAQGKQSWWWNVFDLIKFVWLIFNPFICENVRLFFYKSSIYIALWKLIFIWTMNVDIHRRYYSYGLDRGNLIVKWKPKHHSICLSAILSVCLRAFSVYSNISESWSEWDKTMDYNELNHIHTTRVCLMFSSILCIF